MPTHESQRAILADVPRLGRHLVYDLVHDRRHGVDPRGALLRLRDVPAPERTVIGAGVPLTRALGAEVKGLRAFPGIAGAGCAFPSTQGALWAFLAADDASDLHDRTRALQALLADTFVLREEVTCFKYREGRDLSGFVDGTENPRDDRAVAAAIVSGAGPGLDGSSFVAVQRFVHDLDRLAALASDARDAVIGRRMSTDEEMADAPPSAHVKRSAQESFDPPAFMVRRSMPWGGAGEQGLYFVAYGESLDRFERVLRRMAGLDDGTVDALLSFTRALSGGYYWCPPTADGRIDWSALGV
jgi:putative iron-dependent peroxidase